MVSKLDFLLYGFGMPREDHIEVDGVVIDSCGGKFRVDLKNGTPPVIAQLNGRMRQNRIRVIAGDSVRVALSPYDLTKGLIVYRASVKGPNP
jgi:translation initiation factor IF-1